MQHIIQVCSIVEGEFGEFGKNAVRRPIYFVRVCIIRFESAFECVVQKSSPVVTMLEIPADFRAGYKQVSATCDEIFYKFLFAVIERAILRRFLTQNPNYRVILR